MIGIISDTHDNVENIQKAVKVFKNKKVEFVIHLGDIIAPASIKFFKGLKVKFIKGNCDGDIEHIQQKAKEIKSEYLGDFAEINIKNKKLALYHGSDPFRLADLIKSQKYDYVLHGHTHESRDEKRGKTRIINPGAHYWGGENKIVLLDIEKDKLEFIKLKQQNSTHLQE